MKNDLLKNIKSPQDVKKLSKEQLPELCDEIRSELISTVSSNGGHLASNLGTVELTVALHREFISPADKIIFDVSHQCYTHKLLTGRYDRFGTLRTENGITGFSNPKESEHDVFMLGHSSTSVSSGLGLAVANALDKNNNFVVSVIGDGALGGGLAYEALNNVSHHKTNLIVVINDNKMSISRNVGAMSRHLAVIRSRPSYFLFKSRVERVIRRVPLIGKPLYGLIHGLKKMAKNAMYGSNIFEDMGFSYLGPVDGHDIEQIQSCLQIAKMTRRPAIVHVRTIKGKGYPYAEQTPKDYHGVSSGMDVDTGECRPPADSFSHEMGEVVLELAKNDEKICAVTAAMTDGVGLSAFARELPERFFDVGIAEEHAVTFCSGLAKGGKLPVLAVYSSFLQRGYDQLIHDISTQELKIILCVDRAGFTGEDGETHQGLFDVAFLSSIPNAEIYSPGCYNEMKQNLIDAVKSPDKKLFVIRYPKGNQKSDLDTSRKTHSYKVFSSDSDTMIVVYGRMLQNALCARENLEKAGNRVDVLYLNRIHPISQEAVEEAMKAKKIFFFEEGMYSGGFAEKFSSMLSQSGFKGFVHITAVRETYVSACSVDRAMERFGMDSKSIENTVLSTL